MQQLGAGSTDTIAAALSAGCLCSKIGDVGQAEALLRQAFAASKVAAEASKSQRCVMLRPGSHTRAQMGKGGAGALHRKCRAAYQVRALSAARVSRDCDVLRVAPHCARRRR